MLNTPHLDLLSDEQTLDQFPVVLDQTGVVDANTERQRQPQVRVTHTWRSGQVTDFYRSRQSLTGYEV